MGEIGKDWTLIQNKLYRLSDRQNHHYRVESWHTAKKNRRKLSKVWNCGSKLDRYLQVPLIFAHKPTTPGCWIISTKKTYACICIIALIDTVVIVLERISIFFCKRATERWRARNWIEIGQVCERRASRGLATVTDLERAFIQCVCIELFDRLKINPRPKARPERRKRMNELCARVYQPFDADERTYSTILLTTPQNPNRLCVQI